VVAADSPLTSFTAGGTGELRFDEEHDGLRLGRLLIDYRAQPFETLTTQLTLSATGDNDKNPIDVTEAYFEWRPGVSRPKRSTSTPRSRRAPCSVFRRTPPSARCRSRSPTASSTIT
jgi:hypothetical protein